MKKLIPLNLSVIIKLDEVEDKLSPGGIHIPTEQGMEHQDTGLVEAIGDMAFHEYQVPPVVIGDRVAFDRYAGKAHWDENNIKVTHRIVSDRDIWCRIVEVDEDNNE